MKELMQQLPAEIKRVKEMTNTLQGLRNIIAIYEKQFNEMSLEKLADYDFCG